MSYPLIMYVKRDSATDYANRQTLFFPQMSMKYLFIGSGNDFSYFNEMKDIFRTPYQTAMCNNY